MNSKKSQEHDQFLDEHFKPLEVNVSEEGGFDRAFRNFRTLVQKDRVLAIFRLKQSYEKPSEKKRRKRSEAKQKRLELEMKMKKIISGEYEKDKEKKEKERERKRIERQGKIGVI